MNIFWGFVEIFVKIQMWYFISKIAYDSAISANDWWVIWILKKWFGLSTNAWLRVSLKPFSFGALHPLTHAKQFKLSLGFYSSPMDSADNSMHSITLPQQNSNFCVLQGCLHGNGGPGWHGRGAAGGPSATSRSGRGPDYLPILLRFIYKTLPPVWIRKLEQRKDEKQVGQWDFYI